MEAVDLNFRMNASGNAVPELRKAQGAVKRLDTQIQKSNSRMRGFNNGITTMQKNTRKFAMGGLQQAGYQIGDYAVQVANGTSKMQAFGQQAPQLLQIFGPIGAVVGAGVAIFAAFGVALQKASSETDKLKEKTISLKDALATVERDVGVRMQSISQSISRGFGQASEVVQEFFDETEKRDLSVIGEAVTAALPAQGLRQLVKARQELGDYEEAVRKVRDSIRAKGGIVPPIAFAAQSATITKLRMELRDLEADFGVSADKAGVLARQLQGVTSATTREGLIEALAHLRKTVAGIDSAAARELHKELISISQENDLFANVIARAKVLEKQIGKTKTAGIDLEKVIFDPKHPRFDPVIAEFARLQGAMDGANGSASELSKNTEELGKTALSAVEAQFMLMRGILPPQASADLIKMDELYENVRARISSAADEAARLGKTTLSAVEAEVMLRAGSLPGGAREDFPIIDRGYQRIRESIEAASKSTSKLASGTRNVATVVDMELSPAMKRLKGVQETVSGAFERGFMSVIDGTMSVKDAFKSMASEIIKELYRMFVVKKITGFISDFIGGFGSAAPTTSLRPRLRPTNLDGGGYTGPGARAGGLDGKGGYMAMIHPRETVIDHTKGQGSGGVTVIQNNTFGSGVSRAEVNALLPKMVEATKAAVVDAKLRGGSYGRSFA